MCLLPSYLCFWILLFIIWFCIMTICLFFLIILSFSFPSWRLYLWLLWLSSQNLMVFYLCLIYSSLLLSIFSFFTISLLYLLNPSFYKANFKGTLFVLIFIKLKAFWYRLLTSFNVFYCFFLTTSIRFFMVSC